MDFISLTEYETSAPVALTVEQRDLLRKAIPDMTVEPALGRSDAYRLTPGSRVGTVALEHLAIAIAPKLPIERVLFMVSYSLGLADWGDKAFEMAMPDSLVEAMVPVFRHHLEQALRRGVLQGYQTEEDALTAVRGRIRFDDQVRKRFGILLPVEVRFDNFTEDILANRLLKSALAMLGNLRLRDESSRRTLRRFNHVLELVSAPTFDSRYVPELHYSRLNEHYRAAVEWARLILRFASVETSHGRAIGTTIMFDMDAVFEEFVRVALREELGLTEREFPSGNKRPDLYLDRYGHVALRPDLSWWTGTSCRFIGDVKYKRVNVAGVTHPDLYQLLAYATASGLRDGLLVYAAGEGEPATHEIPLAEKQLHVRSLVLGGDLATLRAEVRAVAAEVRRLAAAAAANAA